MRDIVITSSVLITAVLLIRFLARGKISPILQYALWLPVALRLMIPVPLWNSSISVLNLIPEKTEREESERNASAIDAIAGHVSDSSAGRQTSGLQTDGAETDSMAADGVAVNGTAADGTADTTAVGAATVYVPGNAGSAESDTTVFSQKALFSKSMAVDGGTVLTVIWLVGLVCVGGYMLFYQIKWKKYLRENARLLKGREKYCNTLSVYTVKGLPSPCLCGRNIYLTKEMASDERRLAHILMHEYCHYRHLDSVWVIVRCVLTTVYWFHPLVWAAAYLSKQDSELACDEAALRRLGEEERIAYGKTLLALIVEAPCRRNRIGIASTMSGGEKGIRERIFRIAKKRTYFAALTGLVVVVVAVLAAVTFSGKEENEAADDIEEMQEDLAHLEAEEAREEAVKALQEELEAQKALVEEAEKEMKENLKELEAQQNAVSDASAAVLEKLASYDERVALVDGTSGITDAKNPSDDIQAYYQNGEEVLEEDVYLLESKEGADNSDIKIYGMYTKEFGCRGIKILIDSDVNDFDEPWAMSYQHGIEENVALYELAEDGMPRTFAYMGIVTNTSHSERWSLYLCDRYDTGTINMSTLDMEEAVKQIQERISFEVIPDECKIDVYDNGRKVGSIEVDASVSAMEKIKEVVCDGSGISFLLGKSEEEIRLLTQIGLKKEESDALWYQGLNLLSFSITCGNFGERNLQLGEVSIDTQHVSAADAGRKEQSIDEWIGGATAVADAFSEYQNPCPAATRISDGFGERTHPITQAKITHTGVDLAAPEGSDVLAAADGVVMTAGFNAADGNYILLSHANGECTYYAACQEILVSQGDEVSAGDKIATVGSTGRSTGAHLHFAVSRSGEYKEPVFIGLEAYE